MNPISTDLIYSFLAQPQLQSRLSGYQQNSIVDAVLQGQPPERILAPFNLHQEFAAFTGTTGTISRPRSTVQTVQASRAAQAAETRRLERLETDQAFQQSLIRDQIKVVRSDIQAAEARIIELNKQMSPMPTKAQSNIDRLSPTEEATVTHLETLLENHRARASMYPDNPKMQALVDSVAEQLAPYHQVKTKLRQEHAQREQERQDILYQKAAQKRLIENKLSKLRQPLQDLEFSAQMTNMHL